MNFIRPEDAALAPIGQKAPCVAVAGACRVRLPRALELFAPAGLKLLVEVDVRLNKLIPPLLDAVDTGTLKFVPAADFISHLSEKEQTYLLLVMERDEVSPSLGQAQRLKQLSAEGKLENNIIDLIMREEKPLERKVTIRNDRLQKYFPASYTPKQMEEVIIKLLEGWHRKRQQEQAR